jgi:hypothetical protein
MTTQRSNVIIETFDWRGILVQATYEPKWMGTDYTAHLQIETIEPARAPLPITETGYLSHFVGRDAIEEAGSPTDYALAWLDHASHSRGWAQLESRARQYSLL